MSPLFPFRDPTFEPSYIRRPPPDRAHAADRGHNRRGGLIGVCGRKSPTLINALDSRSEAALNQRPGRLPRR
jgi:hypothetical protein